MREQIAELPFLGAKEAVQTARDWSNHKVFQIGMHTLRGNLSPAEAGVALSNVAEASIVTVLSAVEEDFAGRGAGGGVAAVVLGDVGSREAAPGADLDVLFVYDGGPAEHYEDLCRRFLEMLRELSQDNLLFAPAPAEDARRRVRSLADLAAGHGTAMAPGELLGLTRARCVFAGGDPEIGERFAGARREALARGEARAPLLAELRQGAAEAPEPGLESIDGMRGGLRDVERAARLLQLTHAGDASDAQSPDAGSVFRAAGERGWIERGAAGRLGEAAGTWRSLTGILRLVAEDGFTPETAGPEVKGVIARSCGAGDFDALTALVRETASRAAADVDALP